MNSTGIPLRSLGALILLAFLLAPVGFADDDVPSAARKKFDKAKAYVTRGDEKSLKKAWSTLVKLRDPAARSVDFWMLYVQVGRALEKDEDALWAAIEKREAAFPDCPAFDVVRYHLAIGVDARKGHLEQALTKAPDDLGLKLLMVQVLLDEEDEFEAEELVDAILEARPDDPRALVMKGRLQLVQGYANAAIEFADEHLGKQAIPGLHHLKAEAYLAQHIEDEKDTLPDALTSAEAAVAESAEPQFVVTLARILERGGDLAKARDSVKKHFDATPSPLLAALLGEYAFATGDYKSAIEGFRIGAATDRRSARGLAMCYARTGDAKQAEKALAVARTHDPDDAAFIAAVYSTLGKFAEALEAQKGDRSKYALFERAATLAELGRHADILPDAKTRSVDGSREGEYLVNCWLRARVVDAMGTKAATGAQNRLTKAGSVQALSGVPSAEPFEDGVKLKANTEGLMRRVPLYFRSACGPFFSSQHSPEIDAFGDEGAVTIAIKLWGSGDCAQEPFRAFYFNAATVTGDTMKFEFPSGDWGAVIAAFNAGVVKLLEGDNAGAIGEFDKAIAEEPNWHSPKVFRAAAEALSSEDRRPAASKAIEAACETWPDDFAARKLGVLIGLWARQDVTAALDSLAEREEAYSERRLGQL